MLDVVTIADSARGSQASLLPQLGFNCFQFRAVTKSGESVDVVQADARFPEGRLRCTHHGIPILFPFPNRIRNGSFWWDGKQYQIPLDRVLLDDAGHPIHGFCLDRPWRIIQQTDNSVTGEFQLSKDAPERLSGWPTDARIQVCYTIRGSELLADIMVENPGRQPMPWGLGTHGYFRVPLANHSQPGHCTIFAPCRQQWDLQDGLPTGRQHPVTQETDLRDSPYFDLLQIDAVLTDVELDRGQVVCRIVDEQAGLQMEQRCSADFREIVAFTPAWSNSICLEPYTCVTDAINLQQQGVNAGLQVLPAGQVWKGWISLSVTPVVC